MNDDKDKQAEALKVLGELAAKADTSTGTVVVAALVGAFVAVVVSGGLRPKAWKRKKRNGGNGGNGGEPLPRPPADEARKAVVAPVAEA